MPPNTPATNRAPSSASAASCAPTTRRNVSALFIRTPSSVRFGRGDRKFFKAMADAGKGNFNDHSGQMIESILLSVLVE